MHNRYVLTLAAIEARLYTDEADSIFMRWPTAEKELPSGNHTPGGLSETCLHFMEDIMTKTGRPNHKWDNFLYLHFGGWDLLMDYVKRDPKRRGYLLRCEEKGYSVSGDRHFFDEALVMNGIVNGTAAAIPSSAMNCVVEANVYLVRNFCGTYSSATMDSLCEELRRFLETGSDEEKGLAPQMDPQDRYYIFMYIRACLDQYESARNDGADADVLSRHLGTALAWLVLAALLRDSCENLCRLIPSPSIQLLRVRVKEAQSSPAPAVAPASLPPVPVLFLGREGELEQIGRYFDSSKAPFFICGEGACGKTSLSAAFASHADRFISIYAVYSGDLVNTVASIRFRDTLPMDRADVAALYEFNLSRLTQYSSKVLLIIDNFDAPHYDRTFTEMMAEGGGSSAALGGEAPAVLGGGASTVLGNGAGVAGPAAPALSAKATSAGSAAGISAAATHGATPALTNADVLEDLMRAGVRLLFTTRTSVPPQYASLCLSDAEHELPLITLLALAKKIYTDCRWTEYDEVLMSQIILTVGKHVMLVELLSAALQQQSGFTSLEEVLEKLQSLQLPQIEGRVTTRRSAAAGSSVFDLMRRIFSFSDYEEPVRQMLRQLSLLSPSGMDREPFLQIVGCSQEQGCSQEEYRSVKETLLRLRDLHLVTIDPRTAHITMHPVLSDVAAADLKPDAQNCSVMIANAVRYFDEDSTSRYDARHLEQVSSMCARCAVLLSGQPQGKPAFDTATDDQPQSGPAVDDAVDDYSATSEVDDLLVDLALTVSGIEYMLGNYRAASAWAEQALLALGAMDTPSIKRMVVSLKCAARACAKLGLYEQACRYYQTELEILSGEEDAEPAPFPAEMRAVLATAWNDYGVTLEEMGRFEEALDCLTNAWEIQKDLFGADSLETISTCNNLGLICADLGDLDTAETFYRHAIRISSKYYKEAHPETAVLYSNLGELLMHIDEGTPGEAEDSATEVEPDGALVAESDETAAEPEETAVAHDDALMKSRLAESRQCLTKALDIYTAAYGPSYPENACVLSNLGILEDTEGNHKKAREHYRKALEIQSAVAGIDHPHCADILHNLGVSYIDEVLESFDSPEAFADAPMDQKRDSLPLLNKALACERKALTILTAVFGESHYSVEMLGNEIAWIENEGMRAD